MNDKKAIATTLKAGHNPQAFEPSEEFMNMQLYGNSNNAFVHVSNMTPIFNYSQAVQIAKKKFTAISKKLGIEPPELIILPDIKGKVKGTINEAAFSIDGIYVYDGVLYLVQESTSGDEQEFQIFLNLEDGEKLEGKTFNLKEGSGLGSPDIFMSYKVPGKNARETEMFMDKYYMNLEFGKSKDSVIPGKISLVIPAKHKISIAGNFVATVE